MLKKTGVDLYAKSFEEGLRTAEKLKAKLVKIHEENEKAAELERALESLVDVPLFIEAIETLEWRLRGFSHGFVRLSLQSSIKFSNAPWADEI